MDIGAWCSSAFMTVFNVVMSFITSIPIYVYAGIFGIIILIIILNEN